MSGGRREEGGGMKRFIPPPSSLLPPDIGLADDPRATRARRDLRGRGAAEARRSAVVRAHDLQLPARPRPAREPHGPDHAVDRAPLRPGPHPRHLAHHGPDDHRGDAGDVHHRHLDQPRAGQLDRLRLLRRLRRRQDDSGAPRRHEVRDRARFRDAADGGATVVGGAGGGRGTSRSVALTAERGHSTLERGTGVPFAHEREDFREVIT